MGRYHTLFGCLLFVGLWSSGWIGAKYGQDYAGTFTLLAYRYLLVVVVLLVFVSVTKSWRKLPASQWLIHLFVGILSHAVYLGAGNSALLLGVSAGLVAFITALQPMITATFSSDISGERASFRQWTGLTLGFAAIMLVVSDKIALGASAFAYSLPFIAILALSFASLLDRRTSLQHEAAAIAPTPLSLVTLIHCTGALTALLPMALITEGFHAQWGFELLFSVLWLALVVSLGAYGMMFFMLRRISAIKVASLGYLAPPATMLMAYFMFGEVLSVVDIGGMLLAGFAVWLIISKQSTGRSYGSINVETDPILRPPVFAAQRVSATAHFIPEPLNRRAVAIDPVAIDPVAIKGVDIDVDYLGKTQDQQPRSETKEKRNELKSHSSDSDHIHQLETQLEQKNREIERLNTLGQELKVSHRKIELLKKALFFAEKQYQTLRQDQPELGYPNQSPVSNQASNDSRPPGIQRRSQPLRGNRIPKTGLVRRRA